MARATGIGGVFLRSDDPQRLQDWYQTHLGLDVGSGAWIQDAGPTILAGFARDSDYFSIEKPLMLNFRVDDLDTLTKQLRTAGITVVEDPSWNSEIGRFARIHDPDGNPVELWEPAGPAAV
jgi:catechol 2,3-dioxygenase-like lactoylglutathione lyase family enzyme